MSKTKPKWISATNSPSDGQIPSYDNATGQFEWVNNSAPVVTNKELSIGDWNMDTTADVSIAHGLSLSQIRSVEVVIFNDAATEADGLDKINYGDEGYIRWDGTNIILRRAAGGHFDSVDYDSTTYNRGYITVWYKVS